MAWRSKLHDVSWSKYPRFVASYYASEGFPDASYW